MCGASSIPVQSPQDVAAGTPRVWEPGETMGETTDFYDLLFKLTKSWACPIPFIRIKSPSQAHMKGVELVPVS